MIPSFFLATGVGSTCTVDGATLKGPFSAVPANNNASRVMHRFLLILLTLTIGNSRHREDLQCVHSLPRSARRSPWSTRGSQCPYPPRLTDARFFFWKGRNFNLDVDAKECQSDRSRQAVSSEYWVARFGGDTTEREPLDV